MSETLLIISRVLTCMAILLFVRNHIVFKYRKRRLQEVHTLAIASLDDPRNTTLDRIKEIYALYDTLDTPSYDAMLFDLRRWTFKQFYPQPVRLP